MMTRFVPLLLAAAAVPVIGACGDLSQEDLLFRASLPSKADVELQSAGDDGTADTSSSTASQALEAACADGDLRCNARDTARGLNGLSFGVLDLVDQITNLPPTTRARGLRIWGPYFDAAHGSTSRFEMVRDDDGTSYSFCLHTVAGRIEDRLAKDVTCDTDLDEDTGLAVILEGSFTPGDIANAGARSGQGSLTLRTDRIHDFQALHAHDIEITFDNSDGHHVGLTVNDAEVNGQVLDNPLSYLFDRAKDGSGDLHFDIIGDVAPNVPGLETLSLDARWDTEQAGRALGSVTTAETPPHSFSEDQCWNAHGVTVYVDAKPPNQDEIIRGDESRCAFTPAEVSATP